MTGEVWVSVFIALFLFFKQILYMYINRDRYTLLIFYIFTTPLCSWVMLGSVPPVPGLCCGWGRGACSPLALGAGGRELALTWEVRAHLWQVDSGGSSGSQKPLECNEGNLLLPTRSVSSSRPPS